METAPLKNFATWARRELNTQISARMAAVLAPASPERVENERAVKTLERDIVAAGGGAEGKDAIADQVAYTWFNRVIALRFMDANGYTGAGVVSPANGHQTGQPEILADAKRGGIDPAVVTKERTFDTITGLLDGSRPSPDGQGEAYTLLLAEYCRYWNSAMPFMFEREGDYTELLIPANLLAADSILSRAATTLTTEVCGDVEVIGWLYQFYISERKDEVFAGFKKNRKAGADEIPAATQLFTPHWIVRYLVENSLGRLWMLNHPESRLIDQMDYYIAPVDKETDFLSLTSPEELKVIDPACGSGHMLTYAFDLLFAIYEEEGYAPSQIPSLILTHNLFGTEIDPRAGALAAFALTMKAAANRKRFLKEPVEPNVCVLKPISFSADQLNYLVTNDGDLLAEKAFWNQFANADTFGSLIQPDPTLTIRLANHLATLDDGGDLLRADGLHWAQRVIKQAEYLTGGYSVVVANPPYMGSKQMNSLLSQFMKDEYTDTKQDLYGAFVVRGIGLANQAGLLAIVIGDTWMSIKSFETLRLRVLQGHAFDSFVHMRDVSNHPDIFGANAAFVLSMSGSRSNHAPFIRLTPLGADRKERALRVALADRTQDGGFYLASNSDFAAIPGSPIVYRLSEKMRAAFTAGDQLGEIADIKHGLSTGKNEAVVRFWWETPANKFTATCTSAQGAEASGKAWFPYNSGGKFRRWYGNVEKALRYDTAGRDLMATFPGHRHDGRTRYFHQGVTWSKVSSGLPAFRSQPVGQVFDVAGNGFFLDCPAGLSELLGFCNSSTATTMLEALSPTLNFEAGQIAKIPVVSHRDGGSEELVEKLVSTSKSDWNESETSWEFVGNPLLAHADRVR